MTKVERTPIPRPGGRSAAVLNAVLGATMQLLTEHGFEGFELADVARLADVNKTTVYRRWATKTALLAELLNNLASLHVPIPDTGGLATDFEDILRNVVALVSSRPIRVLLGTALVASDNQELQAARASFWQKRFALGSVVIERAILRGELPPDVDGTRLVEHIAGPVYLRLLVTGTPVTHDDIRATIAITLRSFLRTN